MPVPNEPQSSRDDWPTRVLSAVLALLALATLLAVLAPLRNIPVGIETRAHLEVFSADEPAMVYRVGRHLEEGDLDPEGSFNYGAVYPSLAVGILKLSELAGLEPTERRIALTLRLISWSSYVGILALTFLLLRHLGVSLPATSIATLLLASSRGLHFWGQQIHPDLLQSLLILAAFYLVARSPGWSRAWLAAAICGLAFGTKYSGGFALLFVTLPAVLAAASADETAGGGGTRSRGGGRVKRAGLILGGLTIAVVSFLVAWLALNPYVLSSFAEFRADLEFERIHVGFGHYVEESRNPLQWFALWGRDLRGGVWLAALGVFGVGLALPRPRRGSSSLGPGDRRGRYLWVLVAYVVASSVYLGLEVNMRRIRYCLHYWPVLFVLVGVGLDRILPWIRSRSLPAAAVLLLLASGTAAWTAVDTVRSYADLARRGEDPAFDAAAWMVERYNPQTPILADVYAFRHPYFENFTTILGVRPHDLVNHQPFAVVLMERMSGRFSWKARGTSFRDHDYILGPGRDAEAIQQFHHELFADTSPYRIAYESETIVILELKPEVFETRVAPSGGPGAETPTPTDSSP